MARVHRAQDLTTGREVALKLLKPEIAEHAEAMERFRREAEFLAGLKHPAIVGVEAFGKLPDGRLYLAMELLVGETLGARIRRGKLSPESISPILAGAAVGLDAAHRAGVVHRDLKPDNIFLVLSESGEVAQVKLLDFGISKIDGRQSLTQTGQILGTPRYMAPEQLAGDRDVDGRADVYALGVIVYEALAGQPAFPVSHPADLIVAIIHGRATPLRALRPDVSAELEAVVGRAMARARDARYTSATELAQAWFEVVHGEATHAGVRTGAGTRLMGAMDASGREEKPDEPRADDLPFRPATFREFEAQQAKGGQSTVQLAEFSPLELSKSAADMQALSRPSPAKLATPVVAPPAAQPVAPKPAPAAAPAKPAQPDLRTPSDRGSNRAKEQMMPAMPMAGFGVTPDSPPVVAVAPAPVVPVQAVPASQPAPAPASRSRRAPTPQHATPLDEPSLALPTRRFPFVPILIGLVIIGSCVGAAFGVSALYRRFATREAGVATAPMPTPQPIAPPPPSPHGATGPLTVVPELPAATAPAVDAAAPVAPTSPPSTPAPTTAQPTPSMTTPTPTTTMETARVDASAGMQAATATPTTTMDTTHDGTTTPPPWSGDQSGGSGETPAQLVQRAKDAFRAGNARECVSLATEALAGGADATTYALRGDCYRALGDNSRALRSYQRFCQLAPSHPRVPTVRSTAESLGGTCP